MRKQVLPVKFVAVAVAVADVSLCFKSVAASRPDVHILVPVKLFMCFLFFCSYLVSVMLAAGCFDWALLIAIVLRDSMFVHCILRVARDVALSLTDEEERREAAGMAERILDGLSTLCNWASGRW